MKIVIAPDKFKGNLSSFEICEAITKGIKRHYPSANILSFPMADGGDGFGTVLQHYYGTEKVAVKSVDPLGRPIETFYQWNEKAKTAIIELAAASGIALLRKSERDPMKTSTYGTGIIIKAAIDNGAKKIILGIGGSATNDAGTGLMTALGFQFLDKDKNEINVCGGTLASVAHIIPANSIPSIQFQVAADVTNVLYGPNGAAYTYAAQKGADDHSMQLLDEGLRNFAAIVLKERGKDISQVAGAGAAGGAAAGLMAYFNVDMRSGIDMVIEASGIQDILAEVDLVITGEGKMDMQTEQGKVVSRIAALAKERKIACAAVCGVSDLNENELSKLGIKNILVVRDHANNQEESFTNAMNILQEHAASLVSSSTGN